MDDYETIPPKVWELMRLRREASEAMKTALERLERIAAELDRLQQTADGEPEIREQYNAYMREYRRRKGKAG